MDISKLIMHKKAADFTAAIPPDADCVALGVLYCRLISHSDYDSHAQALGIEWHIRNMAIVHFMNDSVTSGLSMVETARKKRIRAHNKILKQGAKI